MIYWTASNNSSYLSKYRKAETLRKAVLHAREYHKHELHGEGKIHFFENGNLIREDEKSIFTKFKWKTIITK